MAALASGSPIDAHAENVPEPQLGSGRCRGIAASRHVSDIEA